MSTRTTISQEDCAARMAAITGPEYTRISGDAVAADPADCGQIAEILQFANTAGIAVMPTGGGTKLGWGNPVEAEIRLSLKRMNSLREHAWQDLTCTVEAGCTWAAMQAELAKRGQMVALDPLWPGSATVGGVVAANDSGALRLRYGGLRDLIIGMTVVLADGTVARTGGKVVKNVAGYDLHKLMTGSFGTLGVIAEVNFRLHPVSALARTWSAKAIDAAEFDAILQALLDSQITPTSAQLRATEKECTLDVRLAAPAECMNEQAAMLQRICGQVELRESSEEVWQARQRLFDLSDSVILKISALPSDLCGLCSELQRWAATEGTEIRIAAQAAGLMTIALRPVARSAITLVGSLRAKLKPSGGSVVVLSAPEELRRELDVWNCDSNALPLMREIKRRFDPNRILNPGRFVGGI